MKFVKAMVYSLLMLLAFQFALYIYEISWLELVDIVALLFVIAGLVFGLGNFPLSTVIRAFGQATGLMPFEDPPARSRQVISSLSRYALISGSIGTLLSIVETLKNLDNVSALGHGLALSMLSLVYALALRMVVFAPLEQTLTQRELSEGGAI